MGLIVSGEERRRSILRLVNKGLRDDINIAARPSPSGKLLQKHYLQIRRSLETSSVRYLETGASVGRQERLNSSGKWDKCHVLSS